MQETAMSHIRIIGGMLRGRKIPVPPVQGLRPTPDRIRETIFNWLAAECRRATVLDCFSGSGALGFEAFSRGADSVTLIEQDRTAGDNLQQQMKKLKLGNVKLYAGDALAVIPGLGEQYSMVFIDPPYALAHLRENALDSLIDHHRLTDGAQIYLEWPQGETFELSHPNLSWRKHKKAGQVHYAIAEWRLSR
jgi:16S rRNA (guanine966-N2)-methyltransferase